MKRTNYDKELEKERDILNRLIDDALNNGTPISQYEEISEQSRKVDALVLKVQKENERKKKNDNER